MKLATGLGVFESFCGLLSGSSSRTNSRSPVDGFNVGTEENMDFLGISSTLASSVNSLTSLNKKNHILKSNM